MDNPAKDDIDAAITKIGEKARSEKIYVIFGSGYKLKETAPYNNKGIVYDQNGGRLVFYEKNYDVPKPADMTG